MDGYAMPFPGSMPGGGFGARAPILPAQAPRAEVDDLEPVYPSWVYRTDKETGERVVSPPKKPTAAQWNSWIAADEMLWGDTVARFDKDLASFRGKANAVFHDFDPAKDTDYPSTEWAVQTTKLATMIGTTPPRVRHRGRTKAEDKAAQDLEDADLWFLERWKQLHAAQGGGPLLQDMAFSAGQFGRIIAQCFCDPTDPDFPWLPALMDPRTCYPFFGDKHGLVRMTRKFTDTLGRVIDVFDPDGSEKLLKKWCKGNKKDVNDLDLTQEVQVSDCTNRWYRFVTVDGIVVLDAAHRYGRVPYVVRLAPGEFGGGDAIPTSTGRYSVMDVRQGFGTMTASNSRAMSERGVAFMHHVRPALRIREAVGSLAMTKLRQDVNPPLITTSPYPGIPSPVAMYAGGHTKRRPGEVTTPVLTNIPPSDFGAVMAMNSREVANGVLPDMVFGNVEQSNVSGFGVDTLTAAAKDRVQPYYDLVCDSLADMLELKNLEFFNDGHAYVGFDGELVVPVRSRSVSGSRPMGPMPSWATQIMQNEDMEALMAPGFASAKQITGGEGMEEDPPEVVLSRDVLKKVGFRPKVTMVNIGLQSKTVMANYLKLLNDGKFIARQTGMEELPEVDRPDVEWDRILAEDAQTHPKMLELVEFPRALWNRGDVDGFLAYLATVLMPALMQAMGPPQAPPGAAPPGGGPPALGGGDTMQPGGVPPFPGTPQPQGPQAPLGASMAQLPGMAPGSNGAPVGRPF
jgi:hypothetical protein